MAVGNNSIGKDYFNSCQILQFTESCSLRITVVIWVDEVEKRAKKMVIKFRILM